MRLTILYLLTVLGVSPLTRGEAQSPPSKGPFGLRMGMSRAELVKVAAVESTEGDGVYEAKRVPKPHPAFETYLLVVSPRQGLCRISAVGKTIVTNGHGTELREAFDDMMAKLDTRFGRHTEVDQLMSGSLWEEPQYWMMSLLKKDRTLKAYWTEKEGAKLTDGIGAMVLEAMPLTTEKGYLRLIYEFANFEQCAEEIRNKADDALGGNGP